MKRQECTWWVNHLFEIRKEEYFNKGMIKDAKEVEEAQQIVIYALQEIDELEKIIKELADEDYQRQLWRDYKSLL